MGVAKKSTENPHVPLLGLPHLLRARFELADVDNFDESRMP